ncbi:MAG: histidinol dehydrogenase [Rhodospirillaceae bacterium]|nr:histidinol dehydrogenase [Rhodospirillaceae bacterium]|tara:strand:- start:5652 stop:6950 length:1299 start_codon:yes stop_codon:yes gene_type:complete
MVKQLNFQDKDFYIQLDDILSTSSGKGTSVEKKVFSIIEDVKNNGDNALIKYNKDFDNCFLSSKELIVSEEEIIKAKKNVSQKIIDALKKARDRIFSYHKSQLPEDNFYYDKLGIGLGHRWTPISSVGIYVPGGTAVYPSSVLMNSIPAKVANVSRIVMTVPAPNGLIDPVILVSAEIAGIKEIYKIGGAQAVAALAYGTETINKVDKIVGPGNIFVATAKKIVFGKVGIDAFAGPSEILVVSDSIGNPEWTATDLLSQSEHDTEARSILICDSYDFANKVAEKIQYHLNHLKRSEIASQSWNNNGLIIIVDNINNVGPIIDKIAPEHLQLSVDNPKELLSKFSNAGSIFLGRNTPEALGDYIAGPNHVLPTSGTSRFTSGLSVLDFLKRSSIIQSTNESLNALSDDILTIAEYEGLSAHALSVSIRLKDKT